MPRERRYELGKKCPHCGTVLVEGETAYVCREKVSCKVQERARQQAARGATTPRRPPTRPSRANQYVEGEPCHCHNVLMKVPETAKRRPSGGIYCRQRWNEMSRAYGAKQRALAPPRPPRPPRPRKPRAEVEGGARRLAKYVVRSVYKKATPARVWTEATGWVEVVVRDHPTRGRKIVPVLA